MYLENQTDGFNQTSFLQRDKFFAFVVFSLASSCVQGVQPANTNIYSAAKERRQEIKNSITQGPREQSMSQCIPWLDSSRPQPSPDQCLHFKVTCVI